MEQIMIVIDFVDDLLPLVNNVRRVFFLPSLDSHGRIHLDRVLRRDPRSPIKILIVFFCFDEGVTRSTKEPQKLFKLLDMFDSLEKLKPEFSEIFEGEAGVDICIRFRELEKLLVHDASKVFWEFGLQIEGISYGFPPPQDGSVPKLVRYAVNYLKYLATENYSSPMAKVLRTE